MALAHDADYDARAEEMSAANSFLAALKSSEYAAPAGGPPPASVDVIEDMVQEPATASEAVSGAAPVVLGENLNPTFGYTTAMVSTERFLQLYNDMTRMAEKTWDSPEMQTLRARLRETLGATHAMIRGDLPSSPDQRALAKKIGRLLCLLVGHTRDIVDGKGERMLTYWLIAEHYRVAPGLAVGLVRHLVRLYKVVPHGEGAGSAVLAGDGHQYGSWADVKRLAAFLRDHYQATIEHPIIQEALNQLALQLAEDFGRMDRGEVTGFSLAARWSPKATGASRWLFRPLADMLFSYRQTARTPSQLESAGRKAERDLRQRLSALNRLLKTVEVMMSSDEHEWHKIDFGSLPSQALRRHVRAWKNELKNGKVRREGDEDRTACAEHYKAHMARVAEGKAEVKGARCGPAELVHDVRQHPNDAARINGQWAAKMKELPSLGKMVACVDVSGSMDWAKVPGSDISVMDAAIGVGLAIAEKCEPPFNNQVLSFSTDPKFLQFSAEHKFSDRVRMIQNHDLGYSTDFRKACRAFLDVAIQANVPSDFFKEFAFVLLSDMQINSEMGKWSADLAAEIKQMFADGGRRSERGQPYDPPFVVMWNFQAKNTTAISQSLPGAAVISGYSDALLKTFEAEGMQGLLKQTPMAILTKTLESERYAPLAAEWEAYM